MLLWRSGVLLCSSRFRVLPWRSWCCYGDQGCCYGDQGCCYVHQDLGYYHGDQGFCYVHQDLGSCYGDHGVAMEIRVFLWRSGILLWSSDSVALEILVDSLVDDVVVYIVY